jgi:23S rRNA (cytosine1962-C5)-methyltransferase
MTTDEPRVVLRRRRAQPFFFRHPWVFSGAVLSAPDGVADGALVHVHSHDGQWIGRGFYNGQSQIRVRLFSWAPDETVDEAFWRGRLAAAVDLRRRLLGPADVAQACRLVYSDSDGFPGLVVDRYGDYLVMEWGSLGLYRRREMIVDLLAGALKPVSILSRADGEAARQEGIPDEVAWVHGSPAAGLVAVHVGGVRLLVDLAGGQKTGLYLDQRENQAAVAARLRGARVLDAFCYVGGFGLAAAQAGAAEVLGFDTSEAAVALANEAARAAGLTNARFQRGDVFAELRRLRAAGETFDAVILDPPRFAASRAAVPRALRGYKDINLVAMQVLAPGGLLVTCSCSQHVSADRFLDVINRAAKDVGRTVQVVERRGQAVDHPIISSCPETGYLKCFVCLVR